MLCTRDSTLDFELKNDPRYASYDTFSFSKRQFPVIRDQISSFVVNRAPNPLVFIALHSS